MNCPMCGTSIQFNSSHCPHCGYRMTLGAEQPFPNWRKLPGFRSEKPWKLIGSILIYIWIVFAIIASLFSRI